MYPPLLASLSQRLNFAVEFGDLAAQRRAYSNLGNAYIYLADFPSAAINYRNAFRLAQQLNTVELEAQACYSLGNTFTLLREPSKAVVYYLRHLVIARRLGDQVGQGRAHWSLANTYTTLERYDLALRCARRHRRIAQKVSSLIICTLSQKEYTCFIIFLTFLVQSVSFKQTMLLRFLYYAYKWLRDLSTGSIVLPFFPSQNIWFSETKQQSGEQARFQRFVIMPIHLNIYHYLGIKLSWENKIK
ncbi:unnamed protein product [Echinostoma caproni]|uniref:TPR_REGION domain-containing protein n=1 Tax=Echinostoma caproni TaxID=27848 RepID=A0A183BFY0_9TREM|nr:unnamed protein product [Echinostoma caproni]